MKHLAAYLLLGLAGNTSPSADDIKEVLESVGIEADDERLEKLISELDGKDVNELIAEGSGKLASVPSGGAGGGAAGGGAAAGGAAAEEEKAEEKEEEGRVRRGHGLRSVRLSSLRKWLRKQRINADLEKWHTNGLWWSGMVSGVEGSAFRRFMHSRILLGLLGTVKANTVLLL
ncbi:60s acidic ribosomal protein-domain-containing protein [Hypoxylon fuscum]|nr:60s acidic ribosomal protein-domain-containing protein [Hypoxylon fuscum]